MSSSIKQRTRGGGGGGGGGGGRKIRTGKIFDDDSHNNSASASFIGSNVDLSTLILVRLPSKTLLVFKSVSKQWLAIITDPKFVYQHFIRNPKLSVSGIFWGDESPSARIPKYDYIHLDGNTDSYVPFKTLPFAEDKYGIDILQSCNGLLLCGRSCQPDFGDFIYYIFNPFTKKYNILPKSQLTSSHQLLNSVSLAFDPFKSPYYKVIAVWTDGDTSCYNYRIEIFNSESSSWRLSRYYSCTPKPKSIPWQSPGVFWNGSLYWCHTNGCMIYFDIGRELVGIPPMPPSPAQGYYGTEICKIAEYGGHFYFIERDHADGRYFRIFEMDVANSSWNLKGYVKAMPRYVKLGLHPSGSSSHHFIDNILLIIKRGEEKKESTKVVLLTREGMVGFYDLKYRSFKKIYDLTAGQEFHLAINFHQHIESLACV